MGDLAMTAGKPFAQVIRVPDAKNVWTDINSLEVRAQLRCGPNATDPIIANLHVYMTWAFDDDDLVITWVMSGLETRALYSLPMWPASKRAVFNVSISDVGPEDARALVSPTITLRGIDSPTLPVGAL